MLCKKIFCYLLLLLFICTTKTTANDSSAVVQLIKKWAPLVWLAPNEKYFPSNVENYLENVYPVRADHGSSVHKRTTIAIGTESENVYLLPKNDFELKRNNSFLYGKNPTEHPVNVYAVYSQCNTTTSKASKAMKSLENYSHGNSLLHFDVTYWMFYPYNHGKAVCFIGKLPALFIFNTCLGEERTLGNHLGDWEHMSLLFRGKPYPDEIFLAVHDTGVYYSYDASKGTYSYKNKVKKKSILRPKFPPTIRFSYGHPELFAAQGSHGLWSTPGNHNYFRVPKLYDKSGYGTPWRTWENMKIFNANNPPTWMMYRGRWGNPKSKCYLFKKLGLCELLEGPESILTRSKDFIC